MAFVYMALLMGELFLQNFRLRFFNFFFRDERCRSTAMDTVQLNEFH
jgi:hypothetical protein